MSFHPTEQKSHVTRGLIKGQSKIVNDNDHVEDYMSFEKINESSTYMLDRTKYRPTLAIICGSGLAALGNLLEKPDIFNYEDIPNYPPSTVPGHKSRIVIGLLDNIPLMVMQGRFHAYEGYPLALCGMPVRVMKLMGIQNLIVSNAAGGLNRAFDVGDIMAIRDHINIPGFTGMHPLKGPNDNRFGGRFFAMNNCYDIKWRKIAKSVARRLNIEESFHEGIYTMLGGPNFETVAELNMLRVCGVDAVGMSTIPEVLVAQHCGISVFAFSLITNKCVLDEEADNGANHEEVIKTAFQKQEILKKFVTAIVREMSKVSSNKSNEKTICNQ